MRKCSCFIDRNAITAPERDRCVFGRVWFESAPANARDGDVNEDDDDEDDKESGNEDVSNGCLAADEVTCAGNRRCMARGDAYKPAASTPPKERVVCEAAADGDDCASVDWCARDDAPARCRVSGAASADAKVRGSMILELALDSSCVVRCRFGTRASASASLDGSEECGRLLCGNWCCRA